MKFKNRSKEALLGRIFDLGVRKGHTILIWGYAEGYNFDLGIRRAGTKRLRTPGLRYSIFLTSARRYLLNSHVGCQPLLFFCTIHKKILMRHFSTVSTCTYTKVRLHKRCFSLALLTRMF